MTKESATTVTPPTSQSPSVENGSLSWDKRLWTLYASYGNGANARAAAYRQLFAPRVQRFLGLSDIPVEKAIEAMESFFRTRPQPYYVVRGKVETPSQSLARASVEAQWQEPCPSEWAQENFICERHSVLKVRAEADEQGRITKLEEAAGPRRKYRVDADSVPGYPEPHSSCEQQPSGAAAVELPKGTLVEATGKYIQNLGCGPCESLIQFTYKGEAYWTVLAACFRVYDEESGPHTDQKDYLILTE